MAWDTKKVKVSPIAIGVIGTISKGFHLWLNQVSPIIIIGTSQKIYLHGTERTLRCALNI